MDLQAILDESDSSIESSGPLVGDGSSSGGDLERILREDENSDDEVKNTTVESLSTIETAAHHYHLLSSEKKKHLDPSAVYDVDSITYDSIANRVGADGSLDELVYSAGAHNAEDWAVLQQILGEDDDDGDNVDVEAWIEKGKISTSEPSFKESEVTIPTNPDVEAILNSIHSDDEGDSPELLSSHRTKWSEPDDMVVKESDIDPKTWRQEEQIPMSQIQTIDSSVQFQPMARAQRDAPPINESSSGLEPILSDNEQEALTDAALKHAEAYERRILRSGHRDIVSPLHVKRRMKPRFEVGTLNQRKAAKDKNFTNHINAEPQFEFSGLMDSRSMPKLSSYLLDPEAKHGLPTALAVNSKFIAIGFQKGIVCVFDLFEVLRQRLGVLIEQPGSSETAVKKNVGSVSSIDMTMNGEALIAGYVSGTVVLWDVMKASILRSITDSHPSPITIVRFLTDREMKAVSVDAGGLVLKLSFGKNMLWSNYSVDTECLLDGAAGQILAMNVLPPLSSIDPNVAMAPKRGQHPFLQQLVLIALSSERSSFAVAVEPSINVLHRWARPPPERIRPPTTDDQQATTVDLPCLSWGWALVSGGGHVATPILARGWGCCVQLLQANFPESASTDDAEEEGHFWPAFGVHDEFDVAAPVVALEWLGERSLVYLTVANEFTVVDTVMMTLVERLDFSGFKLVYAEFSLSRSANKGDAKTTSLDFCTTFQNSVRFSDDRILVLCQEEVKSVSILGAKRRISTLEQDGEWLEALALALDHYENTIKSQEDRKRDPDGIRDLSKHPEFSSVVRSEDEEWIAKLLLRYLSLAIENAPESDMAIVDDGSPSRTIDLAQSHFQMLAGVCIEFCVVTRRLDLLFGPIFRRFHSVGFTSVFLDVLEPYVLNDKLDYIAPEAMAHFVEHCKATNGVATVERCLLHMDVTIMDFDNILNLLRRNEMYSALIHVYTHGLDDYVTPLEILLERIFDSADEGNVTAKRRADGFPQNPFEKFGYKAILYMRNCFKGKTFPQENDLKPDDRKQTLRPQLLKFLLQEKYSPSSNARDKGGQTSVFGYRAFLYPYTHLLLTVDAKGFLDALSLALDAPDAEFVDSETVFESMGGWEIEVGAEMAGSRDMEEDSGDGGASGADNAKQCPSMQRIMNMLSSLLLPDDGRETPSSFGSSAQAKAAVDAYLDFMAKYLVKGVVRANKSVTFLILSRMTSRFVSSSLLPIRARAQEQIIELVTALPRNSYDTDDILALVDSASINRAALLLHQEGVSSWHHGDDEGDRRPEHLRRAIDCYLNDDEPEFRKGVFTYVKKECTGGACLPDAPNAGELGITGSSTLRGALAEKLPDLVDLDPLLSAQLVAELFIEELDEVIDSLGASDDRGVAQFHFLDAVISGELTKEDAVAGPVLVANLTMDHHQKYLALMAKLYPDKVYQYLSTHDNYRPEECLKLCQEYGIADASAYLLERMGNVSSALQLVLQTLEARLMGLKRVIRGVSTDSYENNLMRSLNRDWNKALDMNTATKKGKEVDGVKRILIVALDLCERNSGTASARSEQSSQLWFNVLDRLINAKGFLRLSKEKPEHAKMMAVVLSELLQITMQRMVSSVPLPDLVRKVTAEHSGSRLNEFREMIVSMLSTYGFELDVCMGAVNVMHHDIQFMEREHRRKKLEGSRVERVMGRRLGAAGTFGDTGSLVQNRDTTIVLGGNGDVSFADGALLRGTKGKTGGLENVLSRLRSRREGDIESSNKGPWEQAKAGLNMMTVSDQLFHAGESSEAAYFGERLVGVLGVAEHYGSFG